MSPSNLELSAQEAAENATTNTVVGTLSGSDSDDGTLTFTLQNSAGGRFKIAGNQLQVDNGSLLDFEAASSHDITVRATDPLGAYYDKVFTIYVDDVNEAPTNISLSSNSVDENQEWSLVGTFTTTDPDSTDSWNYTLVAGTGSDDNSLFDITGNELAPTAPLDFETKPSYSIRVRTTDTGSLTFEKVFTITVNDVNEAPVAEDDGYTILHDTTLEASGVGIGLQDGLLMNDSDPDYSLPTITRINGSTSFTFGSPLTLSSGAILTVEEDGSFTYEAPAGVVGTDEFTYTINDGSFDDEATVTITLTNTELVANDDTYGVLEDQTLTIGTFLTGLLGNDSDADGDTLTITEVDYNAVVFDQAISLSSGASLTLHSDGTFSYTPPSSWTGQDSFTVTISDGAATDTATVTLNVSSNPVLANDDIEQGEEDDDVIIDVLANDMTVAGTLSVDSVGSADHGTVTINLDGTLIYTPDPNWNGADTFNYTITDGLSHYDTGTVTVYIAAINDEPTVSVTGSQSVNEDTDLAVTGIEIDDVDAGSEDVQVTLYVHSGVLTVRDNVTGGLDAEQIVGNDSDMVVLTGTVTAINATLAATNGLVYRGLQDFSAEDTLTVAVDDLGNSGAGGPQSAYDTITITISAVNDAPIAGDDGVYIVHMNTALVVDAARGIHWNDLDADEDELTVTITQEPTKGELTLNADGSFTYTPDTDATGEDLFKYIINDGTADSDEATVTFDIRSVNTAPVAEDDEMAVEEDGELLFYPAELAQNDFDADGDALTVTILSGPSHGTLTTLSDGTLQYVPDTSFVGLDFFTYEVSDGQGGTDQGICQVVVQPAGQQQPAQYFGVTFDRNGTRVAAAGSDRRIRVWTVATGQSLYVYQLPGNGEIYSTVFSPLHENLLAVTYSVVTGAATLYVLGMFNIQTGEFVDREAMVSTTPPKYVGFSSSGFRVVVAWETNAIPANNVRARIFRVNVDGTVTDQWEREITRDGNATVVGVTFQGSNLLAITYSDEVRVTDLTPNGNNNYVISLPVGANTTIAAAGRMGNFRMALAGANRQVYVYRFDFETRRYNFVPAAGDPGNPWPAYATNITAINVSGGYVAVGFQMGSFIIVPVANNLRPLNAEFMPRQQTRRITGIAVGANWIASSSEDGSVVLYLFNEQSERWESRYQVR